MSRVMVCVVAAMLYFVARGAVSIPIPNIIPIPVPVVRPVRSLADFTTRMSRDDREALATAYAALAKAVASNPADEPVFVSTGAVRAAHRAALLCVWKGVLGNPEGKYAGLREALEGVISERVGTDDVPLNPAKQKDAVDAFNDIAATLR